MSFIEKIKPSVRTLATYAVKGKALQPGLIKLNQNENPFDVPDDIKRDLVEDFLRRPWNRYPGVFPDELLDALSSFVHHPVDGIIAGNGSNELMYTVMMAVVSKGSKVLIPSPSFFLYEKAVRIFDGEVLSVNMNPDLSFSAQEILDVARREKPELIVLVSPNSPTGQSMPVAEVERILKETDSIVLVDEAYIEFSEKQSVKDLLSGYDRLLVLRTFSKAFSMAGLRIGYLLAAPSLCAELLKPKIPFTVNLFSASVSIRLMARKDLVDRRIAFIRNQKNFVLKTLRSIAGVESFSSDTNFLIFKTRHPAKTLFDRMLERNVLIRDVSSYPMLERTLRVNIGTEEENKTFLAVLQEVL